MTNETLKSLVKENLDEFVDWLDGNGWTIETEPKLRFVDADGIALPFALAAGIWAESGKKTMPSRQKEQTARTDFSACGFRDAGRRPSA